MHPSNYIRTMLKGYCGSFLFFVYWTNKANFFSTEAVLSGPDYRGPPKRCGILETTYNRLDDAVCSEPGNGFICQMPLSGK